MCIYMYTQIYMLSINIMQLGKNTLRTRSKFLFMLYSRFTKFSVPLLTAILDHWRVGHWLKGHTPFSPRLMFACGTVEGPRVAGPERAWERVIFQRVPLTPMQCLDPKLQHCYYLLAALKKKKKERLSSVQRLLVEN